MTDREKLIELMDVAREYADFECDKRDGCSCCPNDSRNEFCLTPYMVDHLLANGVVVREKGENLKDDTPSLFECSKCGWCDFDTYTADTGVYNFCPNCGADMRGAVNDG